MPRRPKPPRLWFDERRQSYVILDQGKFIRTGANGYVQAMQRLRAHMVLRGYAVPKDDVPATGFVYFISAQIADYPIKIGFTQKSSEIRMADIQVGNPHPLVLLGVFDGTYRDENVLHRQFKDDRLCGEWFRRSPLLMEIIRRAQEAKAA